jgi:DNA repair exonuclease SbcCD ATPase subunit
VRLLRLKADFGPLRGEWRFDPRRVNLVVDDNERGKSSLLAALVAALYGLDGDRRTHRVLTPLERWRPWNGRPFEVTLEVETRAQRYLIHRDFDRDGVRIMDRDGDDVTAEFFEDKGYPVGRRLLGLDAAEFDRAAFLRLGDLDEVVPADERARRASTLRARLENAADTHIGDTNASEALRVLEEALRRYHAPELEFTGTVEVALDRLEAKRQMLLSERRTIEHDLERAAGPLERLTRLAEEEDALKQRLRALEAERHAGLAAELRQRLDEDDRARAEVARLEDEARTLEGVARLPQGLADEFRVTITRLAETRGNLDSQEQRQRERVEKERAALEAELASLAPYREHSSEQADQCAALAAELRRITLDEARLRHEVFVLRDQLAAAGYEPERIQHLTQRFAHLPEESQRLLRQQNPLHLEFQTRVAELEQERTGASETLRGIDATRNARRVPGWVALALGIARRRCRCGRGSPAAARWSPRPAASCSRVRRARSPPSARPRSGSSPRPSAASTPSAPSARRTRSRSPHSRTRWGRATRWT